MGQVERYLDLAGDIFEFGHPVATQHLPLGRRLRLLPHWHTAATVTTFQQIRRLGSRLAMLYCIVKRQK